MITIITSTYKSEKFLKKYFKNIKSFFDRNNNIEIIVISNETNRKEEKILHTNKLDKIKVIKVPRESIYTSWNRGVREAKYNYITFWNVDDIRFGDSILEGIKNLEKNKVDITYFPFIYKRYINILGLDVLVKRKKIDPPIFDRERFKKEMHCGPFFMFTKEAFMKNGPFDEKMKISGDFDWCARASKNGLNFIKTDCVAGIFKNNGKTLSGSKDKLQQIENKIVYERNK